MFVSRLSANELALTGGLTGLGIAFGSIVYSVEEIGSSETSRTMKGATRKQTQILRSAYGQLEEHASRLGASGVIGVEIIDRQLEQPFWEYTVQGTAVSGCAPASNSRPFTSTFSGQEYFTLAAAGYRPISVVFGVHVYYQKFHQRVRDTILSAGLKGAAGQNAERSDYTRGIYTARRHAMTALEAQADSLGADGVIGIAATAKRSLDVVGKTSRGMLIEFAVIGTAIKSTETKIAPPLVSHTVPLNI